MRLRTRSWFLISLLLLIAAGIFWHLGNERLSRNVAPRPNPNATQATPAASAAALIAPIKLLTETTGAGGVTGPNQEWVNRKAAGSNRFPYRLSNTPKTVNQLVRSETAILLRNAFIDTAESKILEVPESLRSAGDPGSYIVQARGPVDEAFRSALRAANATIISYIPNNAFLVRASAGAAQQLASSPRTQSVLPYEPYYKLDERLLALAVGQKALPENGWLRLTLFPGEQAAAAVALKKLGAETVGEDRSPFGPILVVKPSPDSLVALAQLPSVQGLSPYYRRAPANDMTRVRVGVSADVTNLDNYLGLTGTNVLVSINDTGVDATHPDLAGRVTSDLPSTLVDDEGHGTYVAGTLAGSGLESPTVPLQTNVAGSFPGTNTQFRGMAPMASLFALPIDLATGPLKSDAYLQETAARTNYVTLHRTNTLISNNSWDYPGNWDYDIAAASYDAAVRDALPDVSGSQPIAFVFAAGNQGRGDANGLGGEPESINSPATAKNVISVGAIDSPRNLTNEVVGENSLGETETNAVYLADTDSDNQVASFSSRGNVGIGIEGDYGRFKPDVVAPGAFLISTRRTGWLLNTNYTYRRINDYTNITINPDSSFRASINVPTNAVALNIYVLPNQASPIPFPDFPLYIKFEDRPGPGDFIRSNTVINIPPDRDFQPGDWKFAIGAPPGDQPVSVNIRTELILKPLPGNALQVLYDLNEELGTNDSVKYYRYEQGTSMSTPVISGMLALMQEFFEKFQHRNNISAALMKALLINGAHSVNPIYNLCPTNTINHQGWGLVNLTNSLPMALTNQDETAWPLRFFDQSPTNALATGQSFNQSVTVSTEAQEYPLRVTLAWTDPPGNPTAAIKLVNDLDLVVSNTVTHEVYYGNGIPAGNDFNSANATNMPAVFDAINNVENVFIPAPVGSNYVVTVFGRRVNVNAVTAHTNNVVQDYALVISSGYSTTNLTEQVLQANALTPANEVVAATPVTVVTNGVAMLNQMVGANSPLLPGFDILSRTNGVTNQWHFYVFTNAFLTNSALALTNGSNVAFVTFMPPNLSVPRNRDADIDMYVSQNPALTNLDPFVVASADKSTNRGGTELVVYTNAPVGADSVYYIGIKSEDQEGAEYGFVGLSSNRPFDEDVNGNRVVHGLPVPAIIPDGSPEKPGGVLVFGIVTRPLVVRRVVATNVISHEDVGDLLVNLDHNGGFSVLLNHTLNSDNFSGTNLFIFDDSHQGDVFGSRPTDKPGTLQNFIGMEGAGLWLMAVTDSSLGHTGEVQSFEMQIEPDLGYLNGEVLPNQFSYYYIDVPDDWYSLSIILDNMQPGLPLDLYLRRGDLPTLTDYDKFAQIIPPGGMLTLRTNDVPPLAAGRYYIGVYNPNNVTVRFHISADYQSSLSLARSGVFFSQDTPLPLLDDALTTSTIDVPVSRTISDVRVGLRIDHPRVSDLVLRLVSPQGTRVLLMENRGGFSTNGLGSGTLTSNLVYAGFAENPVSYKSTNLLASQLIKFVVPPFTTNANTVGKTISDFETSTVDSYTNTVDGWTVLTNHVDILSTNLAGGPVSKVLRLKDSGIRRSLNDLIAGQQYVLTFDYLPVSPTGGTNASAPTFTNSPAVFTTNGMVLTWESEPGAEYIIEVSTNLLTTTNTVWAQIGTNVIATGTNTTFTDLSATTNMGFRFYRLILKAGPPGSGGNTNWTTIQLVSSLVFPTGGGTEISWNSVPGGLYRVEATTDFIQWVAITNVTATEDTTTVTDPASAGSPMKFYRVLGLVPSSAPQDLGVRVYLDGVLSTNLNGSSSLWRTNTLPFMANNNFTTLEIDALPGRPGVYLDNFVLTEIGKTIYFLPEESLNAFIGENSLGNWTLEILDDRVGATNPPPTLLTWELQLNFVATNFPAVRLVNGVWSTNTVSGSNTTFFIVDVPRLAIFATNFLENLSGGAGLRLLYNQDGLPLGGFGNVTLFDLVGPGIGYYPLSTNRPPDAPLRPGQRYYLGVQNIDPNETNTFRIRVDFDRVNTNLISAITLTNAVPYTNTIAAGVLLDYYQFDVSSSSTWATFEIVNPSGNVNLQLHKGVPLPTPAQYDYQSANPGTNNELITLFTNSLPVQLSPGTWYLGVNNLESNAVKYMIVATEYSGPIPVPIALSSGVGYTNTVTNGVDLYEFTVSPDATWASFELLNPSGNVDLYLRKGPSWPTRYTYDYQSSNPGTNEELILLFPSSQPVPLSPGNWYLSVFNEQTKPVTYTLVATEYTNQAPNLITLTNGVAYANTNLAANPWDYYLFRVSNQATQALFETLGASGNIDLFVRKGLPLPDATNAFYASRNAGTNDERIVVTNNMAPVSLSPGLWLLGVLNAETNDVTYNIRATEYLPQIPVFTNLFIYPNVVVSNGFFWLTWDSMIGATYQVWGREKVEGPGWNVMASNIVAIATNTTYAVSLTNSNHFFIVVMSALPPVTPPTDTNLVIYPNVVVTNGFFRLTWDSMIGATYQVWGREKVEGPGWNVMASNIVAIATNTTYAVSLTNSNHFFIVVMSALPPVTPPGDTNLVINSNVVVSGTNFVLSWSAVVGATYRVDEITNVVSTNWVAVSPVLTATNSTMIYSIPVQGGGLHFFRVVKLSGATPPPAGNTNFLINAQFTVTNKVIRIVWNSQVGTHYYVQERQNFSVANWTTISPTITATNTATWFDAAATNAVSFFRVVQGSAATNNVNPPNPDPSHWVWIVPGTFMMGSPSNELARLADEVQHPVTIRQGFWMGKTEVTQVEYWTVMSNNPSQFTDYTNLPVEQVTWHDATNYCGKLTEKERSAGSLPTGYAYRLPTEAEWEYCCRAGTTAATAFGNGLSSTQANFNGTNSYGGAALGPNLAKTAEVASYAPNAWGLYDLHGNVGEWCGDWYGAYPTGSVTDPKGPATGTLRVARGGSWDYPGSDCRSAYRGWLNPAQGLSNIGFRPVLAPELP